MGPVTIEPYPMPTQDLVPRSVAPWSVDPDRAALLIHNMQNHLLRPFPAIARPWWT